MNDWSERCPEDRKREASAEVLALIVLIVVFAAVILTAVGLLAWGIAWLFF